MARVSVAKWGNSLAIRLPRHVAQDLELDRGSELELDVVQGKLIARPLRQRRPLAVLVKGITAANRHAATDWGPPRGREVW